MGGKNFLKLVILNLFTSGQCMITQMALSIALSYIFSNSIFVFSFFTGLYLMSMGLGVLIIEKFQPESSKLVRFILCNSLIGIILANPGVIGILFLNEYAYYILRTHHIDLLLFVFPAGIALTILIGMISGAELPFFSKLTEAENWHPSKPIISILTSDYIGAFLGITFFTFLLFPFMGLIKTIVISQIVTLICINYVYFSMVIENKNIKYSILLIDLYVLFMCIKQDQIMFLLDKMSGL